MKAVCDATAITTLLKAGREGLLPKLFQNVIVPPAVAEELLAFHTRLPDFLVSSQTLDPSKRVAGTESLGRGEAEAIQLARDTEDALLLTDDRKARAAAKRLGIRFMGLVGVLLQAKRIGLISSVREEVENLEKLGGLYLSPEVKTEALKISGEQQ